MYFFSIPSSPLITLLGVTAKSFEDFDPNVVLFDDKCKWLILKWVKFSKAIHCVLDSLICLGRITDILGARFHICIQNGTRHMQTNLTIFDLEKNNGQSLIHYELHIDRTKSERSVNNAFHRHRGLNFLLENEFRKEVPIKRRLKKHLNI